ncbi:MAG: hypothetical protein ABI550_07240 [Ignavibacteriaceae bacterium]
MNRMYIAGLLLVIIFSGCKKLTEDQPDVVMKDTSISVDTSTLDEKINPGIFQGLYTLNINTSAFRDCENPDSVYRLVDSTRRLKSMYEKIFPQKNVYNTAVIKVRGELLPTEDIALSDNFFQTLYVKEVMFVEKKNFTNTCVPYDFWGFGQNSEWTLQISKDENRIEFNLPSENKTYYFFYAEPDEEKGIISYSNYNKIQRYVIEIFIRKEKCTDANGRAYNYSVQINLTGDKRFKGCAIRGAQLD